MGVKRTVSCRNEETQICKIWSVLRGLGLYLFTDLVWGLHLFWGVMNRVICTPCGSNALGLGLNTAQILESMSMIKYLYRPYVSSEKNLVIKFGMLVVHLHKCMTVPFVSNYVTHV